MVRLDRAIRFLIFTCPFKSYIFFMSTDQHTDSNQGQLDTTNDSNDNSYTNEDENDNKTSKMFEELLNRVSRLESTCNSSIEQLDSKLNSRLDQFDQANALNMDNIEKSFSRQQSNFVKLQDESDKFFANVSSKLLTVQSTNDEPKEKINRTNHDVRKVIDSISTINDRLDNTEMLNRKVKRILLGVENLITESGLDY